MLRRKVWKDLERWKKESRRTAAALIGARQIGKSTIARAFAMENYRQFIEINFINDEQAKAIFESRNADEILTSISAYTRKEIISGNTLILLDEIQECPSARTAIKFLVENGRCDYIETGSLLGIKYREIQSYPVGFEEIIPMFPLDFEEFLWAVSLPEPVLKTLENCFQNRKTVPEAVHHTMLQLFQTYMVVGGMPAVVQDYVDHRDIASVNRIQNSILDLYRLDVSKYAPDKDKNKIRNIFDSIPSQLDAKNNRFRLASQGKHARIVHYEEAFLWLEESGIGLVCYNTSAPVLPLQLNAKRSLFKLYFCDTGLLCAFFGGTVQYQLLEGNTDINSGALLENVFAQSLHSAGFPLYYYDSKKIGELDFVIADQQEVDVLEIKSGNTFQNHRALNNARRISDWKFRNLIVYCKSNVHEEDGILYLPLYMIMFYRENKPESMIWDIDLSNLLS